MLINKTRNRRVYFPATKYTDFTFKNSLILLGSAYSTHSTAVLLIFGNQQAHSRSSISPNTAQKREFLEGRQIQKFRAA